MRRINLASWRAECLTRKLTQRASRFLSRAFQGTNQIAAFATRPFLLSPSPLNIVNPIHTSMSRGCTCKLPLVLSEIIALHDTFACSCTNAQSSGDPCTARRPQLCLIAARKIGGSFANPSTRSFFTRNGQRIRGVWTPFRNPRSLWFDIRASRGK